MNRYEDHSSEHTVESPIRRPKRPHLGACARAGVMTAIALALAPAGCADSASAVLPLQSDDLTTVPDGGGAPSTEASVPAPSPKREWYQFGFQDYVLDQVTLFYLGHVWDQSADVGEVLETAARVDETDRTSWTREWRKSAERLEAVAQDSELRGHPLSASHAYLRSATYYRAALHRHANPFSPEVPELAQRAVTRFGQYLKLSGSPCTAVQIPYEGTTLPGYFCKSAVATGPAPVVLFQEGRDGWAEDGHFLAAEAMKRGFHALLFDGPGMGQVLRLKALPFRHDWENVITPVVDWAVSRPEVDAARIGLVSFSMGGFLGPRAATREHRLKALIANPGVLNWGAMYEGFVREIDPTLLSLLDTDEAAFDARIDAYMRANPFVQWGFVDSMWHHGVSTPAQLLREARRYVLGSDVANITARTLVIDAEAEQWGQAKDLFAALQSPKEYLLFTAAEAAQIHVQPGAAALQSQRMLEWLESTL